MKILIIEDERLLAGSIKDLLEIQGFEAEAVYDGETGFTYAGTGIYDLIILDVMMPGKSGYEVARELRASRLGTPCLDLSTAVLSCGDRQIRLSAKEFDIMRLLFQSGVGNLSKEMILEKVWGYDSDAVENHVEVYIGFLRKKLLSIESDVRIESIRRMGYHLEVAEHDL